MSVPAAALPSPLTADQAALVARLTDGLDPAGLWWLSGYAAGLAQRTAPRLATLPAPVGAAAGSAALPAAESTAAPTLTIVFGSQTGNAKRVAEQLGRHAEAAGVVARVVRADAYPLHTLKDERLLAIVVSTQGDGDPPDDARGFVEFLAGRRAPRLEKLKYAVLGLGDSSYPRFNEAARALDARLAALGGERLLARGEADVDIDAVAGPWLAQATERAKTEQKTSAPLATVTPLRPAIAAAVAAPAAHGRERPFAAEILANQRLTSRHGTKDIRHVELSLDGAGLAYRPGDALGVWPANDAGVVDTVLATLRLDGETAVAHGDEEHALRDWLRDRRELTKLSRPFLQRHAQRSGDAHLAALLADPDATARVLASWQLPDLLHAHAGDWNAGELVAALRPLAPRLYSIASSPAVVGAEAHLTVARVEWDVAGARRHGVASHHLATRVEGDVAAVFVEPNERFRLPADPARDIVMIGPGTGVAPFRGFVQERAAVGASGRNWLLFGAPHRRHDFLYQAEWLQARADGRLARLDVAFSRDPKWGQRTFPLETEMFSVPISKTYVQHRLREHGRELFAWLEGGAHLYVCGAVAMARDVDAALRAVIATHGGRDADGAGDYVSALMQQGRYARDVY